MIYVYAAWAMLSMFSALYLFLYSLNLVLELCVNTSRLKAEVCKVNISTNVSFCYVTSLDWNDVADKDTCFSRLQDFSAQSQAFMCFGPSLKRPIGAPAPWKAHILSSGWRGGTSDPLPPDNTCYYTWVYYWWKTSVSSHVLLWHIKVTFQCNSGAKVHVLKVASCFKIREKKHVNPEHYFWMKLRFINFYCYYY